MWTRRFCGSRTPSSVCTIGSLSPFAEVEIEGREARAVGRADRGEVARDVCPVVEQSDRSHDVIGVGIPAGGDTGGDFDGGGTIV